jgi:putative membrane protein
MTRPVASPHAPGSSAALPARLSFFDPRAKARAVLAVKAFEACTSAELVVTVKKQARAYLEAHLLWGAVAAFAALLVLLFFPMDFHIGSMPIDVLAAFGVGFALSRLLPPVQRLVVARSKRRAAVEQAARAAFFDLGVSATTGRTGLLVYLAVLEGMVALCPDTGVTPEARRLLDDARGPLETALGRLDLEAFTATLERLGPAFAATMPRAEDDVNELPDEVT